MHLFSQWYTFSRTLCLLKISLNLLHIYYNWSYKIEQTIWQTSFFCCFFEIAWQAIGFSITPFIHFKTSTFLTRRQFLILHFYVGNLGSVYESSPLWTLSSRLCKSTPFCNRQDCLLLLGSKCFRLHQNTTYKIYFSKTCLSILHSFICWNSK